MSLRNCTMTSGMVLFVVLLLFGCGGGGGSDTSVSPQTPQDDSLVILTLGVAKTVAAQTVPPTGADIIVDAPDDPLDGLQIHLLADAYGEDKDFTISSTPIIGHSGNPNFNPVTPLITIQNGGEYSEKPMAMKIPVTIEEGYHYMAFFYDETTGRLEGMPELAHDENSLTVATNHFSNVVVNRVALAREFIEGTFDSGFRVGIDNWNFYNDGSYVSPGGICSGMSVTALFYYTMKKVILGEKDLFKSFLGEDPLDDRDDEDAIKFASMVQYWQTYYPEDPWDVWEALNESKPSHVWSYFMFIHAIKVTQQPQYMVIYPVMGGDSHAVIAYKKEGDGFLIADPNDKTDATAKIGFTWLAEDPVETPIGGWTPFYAQWDTSSEPIQFGHAYYFGHSAIVSWDELEDLYARLEDGTAGDTTFPEYTLTITDQDENSDEFETTLTGGYNAQHGIIKLSVSADPEVFNPYLTVVQANGLGELEDTEEVEIHLATGINRIGVYITDENTGAWTDFQYFDITYNPIVCEEGEELVDGECVPVGCNLVCDGEPIISDTIVIPSHDGSHSVTLPFTKTYKMCTRTVTDPTSISGKVTMLYFFLRDGSYTYSRPNSMTDPTAYDFGEYAFVNGGSDNFAIQMRGLSNEPSASFEYRDNSEGIIDLFGFDAYAFDEISADNEYDFLWLKVRFTPTGSYSYTVLNPEGVDENGCYSGIH